MRFDSEYQLTFEALAKFWQNSAFVWQSAEHLNVNSLFGALELVFFVTVSRRTFKKRKRIFNKLKLIQLFLRSWRGFGTAQAQTPAQVGRHRRRHSSVGTGTGISTPEPTGTNRHRLSPSCPRLSPYVTASHSLSRDVPGLRRAN